MGKLKSLKASDKYYNSPSFNFQLYSAFFNYFLQKTNNFCLKNHVICNINYI